MQLVTIDDLASRTRLCRTTIWRYRRRFADFPKPVLLNGIHPRWIQEEVDAWLLSQRERAEGGVK